MALLSNDNMVNVKQHQATKQPSIPSPDVIKQGVLSKHPSATLNGGLGQAVRLSLSSSRKRCIRLTKGTIAWYSDDSSPINAPLGKMNLTNATVEKSGGSLIITSASRHAPHDIDTSLGHRLVLTDFPPGEIDAWELAVWRQTPTDQTPSVKVLGIPLSSNCTGAAMIAMEAGVGSLEVVDFMGGDHKKPPFLSINPFGQLPAMEDGDLKLAESHAILHYLASKYYPSLYPKADPKACAKIDWAMEAFTSYVYKAHSQVVYVAMGFAPPPEDQLAANAAYHEALNKWASVFLSPEGSSHRFINGDSLSIADFKVASFCFPACEPAIQQLTGFEAPARIQTYVDAFFKAVRSASILTSFDGFSMREFLEAKAVAAVVPPPSANVDATASGLAEETLVVARAGQEVAVM